MTTVPSGQLSEDRLWQWSGREWQPAPEVTVRCGRCETETRVSSKKPDYKCAQGHKQSFVACTTCARPFQVPTEKRDHTKYCPHCGISSLWAKRASAWAFASDERHYGTSGATASAGLTLPNFTLSLGIGTTIAPGTYCSIEFGDADVSLKASHGHVDVVPFSRIREMQVTGHTNLGTDAEVRGGARGALSAISPLTAAVGRKSTSIDTALRIACDGAEYVFVSQAMDSGHLARLLDPWQERIRHAEPAPPPPPPTQVGPASIADELTKLAQLRSSGILTDEEFAVQKAKLLG